MALRIVRVSSEVFGVPATGEARVARLLAEVAGQTDPDLRLYRVVQQVLIQRIPDHEEEVEQSLVFGHTVDVEAGDLRIVRVSAEVLGVPATGEARVARLLAEVAGITDADLRLYRVAQYVLTQRPPPADNVFEETVSQGLVFGQTAARNLSADYTASSDLVFGQLAEPQLGELRITRIQIDVAGTVDSELRVTRNVLDVAGTVDSELRVTRSTLEVAGDLEPDLQLHRFDLQVLTEAPLGGNVRITRVVVDVSGTVAPADLHLHRLDLQVLVEETVVPVVADTSRYRMTKSRTMRQLPRRRA